MDVNVNHEATVTPYQLCDICKPIIEFYMSEWDTHRAAGLIANKYETSNTLPMEELLELSLSLRTYHATYGALEDAAAQGCHLCAAYVGQQGQRQSTADMDWPLFISYKCDSYHEDQAILYLWCGVPSGDPTSHQWVSCVAMRRHMNERGDHLEDLVAPEETPEDKFRWHVSTGSNIGFEMVKSWLRQCVEGHNLCNNKPEKGRPTRLLDLKPFTDCKDLRLVLTADIHDPQYAALSYAWGDCVSTILKVANLSDFMSCIPFDILPKTVKEAIEVCRALDIRYLWVDALCIVQEDSKDFAHEVSHMGSIYAGSLVTVAATHSTHCESGLFRPRTPLQREDLVVRRLDAEFHVSPVTENRCQYHQMRMNDSILSSRAWVFQERILAPRTIHFDANEIIWECRECAMCQRCANSRYAELSDYEKPKSFFKNLHQGVGETVALLSLRRMWTDTVRLFSAMLLSNEDDRLSALAGIAQGVYERFGYEASHGLWLPFFADELLWVVIQHGKRKERNADQLARASSWSWASCQSRVNTNNPPLDRSSKREFLYRCNITALPSATPFCQLSALTPAPFRVSGWATRCRVVSRVARHSSFSQWMLVQPRTADSEEHEDQTVSSFSSMILNASKQHLPIPGSWQVSFFPDRNDMLEQDVLCLTVELGVDMDEMLDKPETIVPPYATERGLVLRLLDAQKRRYQRIGFFHAAVSAEQSLSRDEEEVEIV